MQSLSWQAQLAGAIRKPGELLNYVGLMPAAIGYSEIASKHFPLLIPHAFADRIHRNDPNDPILRQVFPYLDEENDKANYVHDPLAEANVQPLPGLLQKYNSRVLAVTTAACAIHCRYCFRRHFPYQAATTTRLQWQNSLDYIKADNTIEEIILSGGDPLTLSDQRLGEICDSLAEIKHIKRIRFHTRIPTVLPARLSEKLLRSITRHAKTVVFVLHINHANEIDAAVERNIQLLNKFNILVLNQSVLLKGINDSAHILIELSECLVKNGVLPYYLHTLDPVAGAAHFDIDITTAQALIKQVSEQVSGYLVPKLVREEIDAKAKTYMGGQLLDSG